jgi:hypothetical protein
MRIAAVVLIALVAQATPSVAQQNVRFSGEARGCFGNNCTPAYYSGADYLNFTGGSFDGWTHNGYMPITFGYFTWDAFHGIDHIDSPFTLFLSFAYPTGINPDPTYSGDAEGWIIRGRIWGLSTTTLQFEPNSRWYTFDGGQPDTPGHFRLTVRDTYIAGMGRSYLTGYVSDASTHVTPEPISMILMGTGLAGIAGVRRRRRQKNLES